MWRHSRAQLRYPCSFALPGVFSTVATMSATALNIVECDKRPRVKTACQRTVATGIPHTPAFIASSNAQKRAYLFRGH